MIANQVVITSSQFISNTGASEGGAVWTRNGFITNTQFVANSTGCCSNHAGGALFTGGQLFVYGSQFTGNESDHGGAIFMRGSSSEIHDSTFANNFVDCCGGGGAIDSIGFGPFIDNSTFNGNFVGCCEDGGAIRANTSLDVERSHFSNNSIADGRGGALFVPPFSGFGSVITASTFVSNYAAFDGGALSVPLPEINNSTFISNHVGVGANGGAAAINVSGALGDDTFSDNRVDAAAGACSGGLGGAVFAGNNTRLTVLRSTFARSSASNGGALFASGGALIEQSSFTDNSAVCLESTFLSNVGYGGAIAAQNNLTVRRSSFLRNSAGSIGGGALAYLALPTVTLRVENSLFARNVATNTVFGAHGAAIAISSTLQAQLFFNTFASPAPLNVSAIANYSGAASIIDNIITGHGIGIERLAGTVSEDHNLFFANVANTSAGVTSGGSSFTGNPLFVSPSADDYHLGPGSGALDKASDLGITVDFDGDPRPIGAGFDIGFDERNATAFNLWLPLIVR